MAVPGVTISRLDTPPPRSIDTDTGKWFVVGLAERGPLEPVEIRNMSQFVQYFGARETWSLLYDALDTFFHEGGSRAVVSRAVGPAPVKATKNLLDGSAGIAIIVTANEYGDYLNSSTIDVEVSGGNFSLVHAGTDPDGTAFSETVGPYATTAEAVAADAFTRLTLTQGASALDPAATSPAALSTGTAGTDDHGSVTVTQYATALALLTDDYGPGQVSIPGISDATIQAAVVSHAVNHNRTALLDTADSSAGTSSITTLAAANRALDGSLFAGMFWPWATAPGITTGSTRTVPYSAVEAGIIARNDGAGLSVNRAAAGSLGRAQWVTGLSQDAPTTAQWETLADAGVNVARVYAGGVETYGFDTVADPDTDPDWVQLSGSRLYTLISALANEIGEEFVFAELDADRVTISKFGGSLATMLQKLQPSVADFNVNVGEGVNTDESIADGELNAAIGVKAAPFARTVEITIAKVAFDQNVA